MILEKLAGLSDRHIFKVQRPGRSADGQREVTLGVLKEYVNQTQTVEWANVLNKPASFPTTSTGISDSTSTGRALITAADAAAARNAAGATAGVWPAASLPAATASTQGAVLLGGSTATAAATVQQLNDQTSTRTAGGYLWSDGATANRAVIQTPGTRGNLAGAPVASWCGWVDVPTSNPSAYAPVAWVSSATSGDPVNIANGFSFGVFTNGSMSIDARGSPVSNFRNFVSTNFRATYSGQRIWLEVRFTKGTSNPVVRVNGVDISSSFTASTGGTPPEWLDSGLVATNHLTGYNWPAGIAPLGQWLNAHLTDAESEAWRLTGRVPSWVAAGGNATNQANATSPTLFGTASISSSTATSITGMSFGGNSNRIEFSAGNVAQGQRVRVTFSHTFANASNVQVRVARVGPEPYANVGSNSTGGVFSFDFTVFSETGAHVLQIISVNAATETGDISNIRIAPVGALSLPSVQSILVLDDVSGLGGNQGRLATGITPVAERGDWRIVATTNTNGNQQLLGGSVFMDPTRHRLDSWVVNNLGTTRTVSLGNVSAGTQYVSGASYAAGRNEVTLATRFPATANFWCNSNGTDTLVHTITGHRVGA